MRLHARQHCIKVVSDALSQMFSTDNCPCIEIETDNVNGNSFGCGLLNTYDSGSPNSLLKACDFSIMYKNLNGPLNSDREMIR